MKIINYSKNIVILLLVVFIAGCVSSENSSNEESIIVDLDPQGFAQVIENENVFVLDTHVPEQEHIKGTDQLIAFNELIENQDKLPADKNTPIAVYCRSGSMSAEASQTLKELGYTEIYNLAGGANAWRAEGLEFGELKPLKSDTFCLHYLSLDKCSINS